MGRDKLDSPRRGYAFFRASSTESMGSSGSGRRPRPDACPRGPGARATYSAGALALLAINLGLVTFLPGLVDKPRSLTFGRSGLIPWAAMEDPRYIAEPMTISVTLPSTSMGASVALPISLAKCEFPELLESEAMGAPPHTVRCRASGRSKNSQQAQPVPFPSSALYAKTM